MYRRDDFRPPRTISLSVLETIVSNRNKFPISIGSSTAPAPLSRAARWAVLIAAFTGLLFDGIELGLMPVASLSVSRSLFGAEFTDTLAGDWFARFTASLMLGAAVGGILLGSLGDRIGRTRAMGVSILFYSIFAGLGAFVQTQEQMLALRFLVGLGVGGMWPNGVVLVSECWPNTSRPVVAGVMGAGVNAGILLLSQLARHWPITPDSWRWIFQLAAVPALLGIVVIFTLPESPKWLASRSERRHEASAGTRRGSGSALRELFRPPLLRLTFVGIVLASIPLVGAWAASKWMIPWADKLASATQPGYKAVVQGWWALGATLGSFVGAQVAAWFGRRLSYCLISFGTTALTIAMFQLTAPLEPAFLPVVFAQGFVATLFFGWLPFYLPELFPTRVRATGSGLAMNSGRFATAIGVFISGALFAALGGSYPMVGAFGALIYSLGMIAIWFAPDTSRKNLED
jgi:MFS family permease